MNKPKRFWCSLVLVSLGWWPMVGAQTPDADRIADLQARFKQGVRLENQGKLPEALEVFKGIIKDEPTARGSMFYAGLVSMEMNKPEDAIDYLNKFRELEPKDFKGIVLLLQANEALRRTVKVEALRDELFALRASGNIPGLSDAKSYTRERIFGEKGGYINLSEFFDYKTQPNFLFMGEQKSAEGDTLRRLYVFFNSDETTAARAKNPKFADVEVFDFSEEVIKEGKSVQINIYRQEYDQPSYDTARKWILDAIKEPPKPLLTAPLSSQ